MPLIELITDEEAAADNSPVVHASSASSPSSSAPPPTSAAAAAPSIPLPHPESAATVLIRELIVLLNIFNVEWDQLDNTTQCYSRNAFSLRYRKPDGTYGIQGIDPLNPIPALQRIISIPTEVGATHCPKTHDFWDDAPASVEGFDYFYDGDGEGMPHELALLLDSDCRMHERPHDPNDTEFRGVRSKSTHQSVIISTNFINGVLGLLPGVQLTVFGRWAEGVCNVLLVRKDWQYSAHPSWLLDPRNPDAPNGTQLKRVFRNPNPRLTREFYLSTIAARGMDHIGDVKLLDTASTTDHRPIIHVRCHSQTSGEPHDVWISPSALYQWNRHQDEYLLENSEHKVQCGCYNCIMTANGLQRNYPDAVGSSDPTRPSHARKDCLVPGCDIQRTGNYWLEAHLHTAHAPYYPNAAVASEVMKGPPVYKDGGKPCTQAFYCTADTSICREWFVGQQAARKHLTHEPHNLTEADNDTQLSWVAFLNSKTKPCFNKLKQLISRAGEVLDGLRDMFGRWHPVHC